MAVFEIPLQPFNQTVQMSINDVTYQLRVMWNKPAQCWIMDIFNALNVPLLMGVPLVTGADLLGQYEYMHIGNDVGMLVMTLAVGRSPSEIPTQANLGTDGKLYYITPEV